MFTERWIISLTACPDPLVLILLVAHPQLLKSLVCLIRGDADLREWLTFLPFSSMLRNGFVTEVTHHAFEGIVAKDKAAEGDKWQLGKYCQQNIQWATRSPNCVAEMLRSGPSRNIGWLLAASFVKIPPWQLKCLIALIPSHIWNGAQINDLCNIFNETLD